MSRASQTSLFLIAIVISVNVIFAQSTEQTLQRHVNDDGQFEALMPANTRSVTVPGKEIIDTYYEARGKAAGADYRLKVQVISPIDLGDENLTKQITDKYVSQAREQQQNTFGRAKTDQAISQHGMQGRDFLYAVRGGDVTAGPDRVFRQRVMFDGKRLYIASLSGSADAVNSKSGTEFLESVQPLRNQTAEVYSDTEGRFEAIMHGKPELSVVKVGDGPDDVQHQYSVGASDGVYMVAYQDHSGLSADDPAATEELFTAARDGFQKGIDGKQTEYKTITQGKLTGRETRFRIPAKQAASTTRMFYVNHRWYHVFVLGTTEFVNSKLARQFLDSFQVTGSEVPEKLSREELIQKLKDF